MISSAMVTRYASALVDVVTGPAGTDAAQANQQLRAFAAVLAGSAELRNALTSPAVSPARKRAVVGRLADQLGVAKMVRNFLLVLSDHRRLAALPQMIDTFETLLDERLGFVRADSAKAGCRGVLAAQQLKPQAVTLAEARGIRCVEVDLDVLRGLREPELTLFTG